MQVLWQEVETSVGGLRDRYAPFLSRHEALNTLPLSILGGERPLEMAFEVRDAAGELRMVVARSVGKPVVLSTAVGDRAVEGEAVDARGGSTELYATVAAALLGRELGDELVGPAEVAWGVARILAEHRSMRIRTQIKLGAYVCEQVVPPAKPAGEMRVSRAADIPLLTGWSEAFSRDCNLPSSPGDSAEHARRVAGQRAHLWALPDGTPVAVASWGGPTPTGVRVSFVYTPPEHRGRGYASALVAALTKKLLEHGSGDEVGEGGSSLGPRERVFLFTDLLFPTSNRIYQRIGYRFVGEHAHLVLEKEGGG